MEETHELHQGLQRSQCELWSAREDYWPLHGKVCLHHLHRYFPTSGPLFLFRRPVVLARCANLARQLSSYPSSTQSRSKAHPWKRFHLTLTNPIGGNSVPVPVHHRAKRNSHAFVFCAGERAKTEVQKIAQLLTPGLSCQSWTDFLWSAVGEARRCLALTASHTVLFAIPIATGMKNRTYWRTRHCQWLSAMITNSQLTPLIAVISPHFALPKSQHPSITALRTRRTGQTSSPFFRNSRFVVVFFLLSSKKRQDMKKNPKSEVTFPLAALLQMAEEFFFITYFSFSQNVFGLKLNTWHAVFQHKWLKLGRTACKRRQGL